MLCRLSFSLFLLRITWKRTGQRHIAPRMIPEVIAELREVISFKEVHAAIPSFRFDCKTYLRMLL